MTSKDLGILGEKIAGDYLKKKGYKILGRNYSPNFFSGPQRGEIDIIAKPRRNVYDILRGEKKDIIVFVEVKTLRFVSLSQDDYFNPEDKVDFIKQRKIIKTAESWLVKNKIPLETKWQIDVLAVKIDLDKKKAKVRHIENAFGG